MLQPTDVQAAWLLENWNTPRTRLWLAEQLLISPSTLYRWAEQLGLSRMYPERISIWDIPVRTGHKKKSSRTVPIEPVLARPAWFQENILPALIGSGRHWPLRDPDSGVKS